jgi:phosphate transport system protein
MVRSAMDAFVNRDTVAARQVIDMDDEVDVWNAKLIENVRQVMQQDSRMVSPALHCFSAIRHLERIADLATNIAEDAIYLVDGEIVRHRSVSSRLGN